MGPSGVGKDSVITGVVADLSKLHLVRRVITRAPELGGEEYDAVSVERFRTMARNKAFAVHWGAHGLHYGIPATVEGRLTGGQHCIANFSRGSLLEANAVFDDLLVLNITATAKTLAARLAARGRESEAEITERLRRSVKPIPEGLRVLTVSNDGALQDTVAQAVDLLKGELGQSRRDDA